MSLSLEAVNMPVQFMKNASGCIRPEVDAFLNVFPFETYATNHGQVINVVVTKSKKIGLTGFKFYLVVLLE
jgi:hypothetical protein